MTRRRLALVALAVAAILATAVVVEVVLPKRQAERETRDRTLLSPSTALGTFTIARDGGLWTFTPRPEGGFVIAVKGMDKQLVADMRAIEDVHRALSGFGGVRTILAEDVSTVADLAQHGLKEPRLVLTWTDGWERARRLAIGSFLAENQVAAILDDRRLVALPRAVRDVADRDLATFRSKSLINVEWQQVQRIEMERAGVIPAGIVPRIVVQRADPASGRPPETWLLVEPQVGAGKTRDANPTRVGSLVSKLSALNAESFGVDAPTEADLAAAGLRPPVAVVTMTLSSGDPIRLEFGMDASDKLAWARLGDGPLVGVRADLRADVLLADEYYRDNRPIRLPHWNIVNLRVAKGVEDDRLSIEVQKDEKDAWYVVEPNGKTLEDAEGELLLTLLDGVQCGRFEDSLSASPGAADTRWDFTAAGSLQVRASALMPDGRPLRVDLDAVPFLRERSTYYAARTIDQDGAEEVCITGIKAFDPLLDRVRAILGRGAPATPSP